MLTILDLERSCRAADLIMLVFEERGQRAWTETLRGYDLAAERASAIITDWARALGPYDIVAPFGVEYPTRVVTFRDESLVVRVVF